MIIVGPLKKFKFELAWFNIGYSESAGVFRSCFKWIYTVMRY